MAKKDIKESGFALGKENYKLMAIGFAVIVLGFILLAGGGSDDPNVFNPDIFSFRRLTIAPIILLLGFLFEIYAIMKKPKSDS
jgi:membrane-bound ClpP family serine protease